MKVSKLVRTDRDVEITGISVDSRTVKKGDLFICIPGYHYDGHRFAREAVAKGAAAVVCETSLGLPNEIPVEDVRRALPSIYSAWHGYPQKRLKIFGVTGTNGKTSVVGMLNAIYTMAGYRTATTGTLGSFWNEIEISGENTTERPEKLYGILRQMADDGVQVLFMEVSSHALALHRVDEIQFACGIYTNLTPEHMDFHQTMEAYASAKEKLFERSRVGIFNYDDVNSYIAAHRSRCPAYGFGFHPESQFHIGGILKNNLTGISYLVEREAGTFVVSSRLMGEFNISNTLAAAAAALTDGADEATVIRALADFRGVAGRLEPIYQGAYSVYIDYAHTPDALLRVLNVLNRVREQDKSVPHRIRVLFGCGGNRDRTKRPIMGGIAATLADEVIVTSDNAREEDPHEIIREIVAGIRQKNTGTSYIIIEKREQALQYAIETALPGDIILAAGKGHEIYEIDSRGKHPFSEKQILLRAIAGRSL